jgi:predicted AAA+ superfamily ATPase
LRIHRLGLHEICAAGGESRPKGASIGGSSDILRWCVLGGYPELHAKALAPQAFYSDYMVTYLERDVRQIIRVHDLHDFERFLRLCAVRAGQLLSHQSLATDVGVGPNTVKHWIGLLEASGIIHLLQPYYRNIGKRLVKSPKLYVMDTGLLCYLLGIHSSAELLANPMLGAIHENLVLGQLVRWYANRGVEPQVFFYRDQQGAEVDLVIPVGPRLKLIEAKFSENPPTDLPAMRAAEKGVGRANIISRMVICPTAVHVRADAGGTALANCIDLDPVLGPA